MTCFLSRQHMNIGIGVLAVSLAVAPAELTWAKSPSEIVGTSNKLSLANGGAPMKDGHKVEVPKRELAQSAPAENSAREDVGSVGELGKFAEFWQRVFSLFQTQQGFVEKEQLESTIHIHMREVHQLEANYKFAIADVPNKLRVEWDLRPVSAVNARGANPGARALSTVRIYWYNATFEAFDLIAANELVRRTLNEAGFTWSPPPSPHGGGAGRTYAQSPAARLPNIRVYIEPNAIRSDGLFAIEFAGTGKTEP